VTQQTALAYQECRAIARREAKNFYYAFLALPRSKSDAMCAIYAFMRKADDLSDDESISIPERRVAMQRWLDEWRAVRSGGHTTDSIFLAVGDTQQRFAISDELLEKLVQGTTMDLQEVTPGVSQYRLHDGRTMQVYESFGDLYGYCYLVASVVGLVCIRIFGYSDPRAEKFAEETGIAFQLTNILRDVREDTERGRIYLPLDDLRQQGTTVEELLSAQRSPQSVPLQSPSVAALLQFEIDRAQTYYRASDDLIPLLDADSRAAMQVLSGIYRTLLDRIAHDPAQVFRSRVSVPTHVKLRLLLGGLGRTLLHRAVA